MLRPVKTLIAGLRIGLGASTLLWCGCATGGEHFVHDRATDAAASAPNEADFATVEPVAAPSVASSTTASAAIESASSRRSAATTRPASRGGAIATGDAALDRAFAAAPKILAGFDPPAADGAWRVGDQILLGVLFLEDGASSVRFVRYEVRGVSARGYEGAASRPATEASTGLPIVKATARQARLYPKIGGKAAPELTEPSLDLTAEVYDAAGVSLGKGDADIPLASLRTSFPKLLSALAAAPGARALKAEFENRKTPEGRRREFLYETTLGKGVAADAAADAGLLALGTMLFGVSDSFRHYGALRDFRRRLGETIVEAPSMLGAVFGGVIGEVVVDAARGGPATSADALAVPAATFAAPPIACDVVFKLNGDPALLMRFAATEPVPPFALVSGVLAFEGRHPQEAGRATRVRLLAARRGPELGAAPPPTPNSKD
jgi:hypothetical protein